MKPIGVIHSPFKEKFGIPRQSGLVPDARGFLELLPPYNRPEALQALEGYSHVWLQFVFHLAQRDQWVPMVRPPRLGGNRKVGVFASRSPFRPNPLGLSLVKLERVVTSGRIGLELSGIDLLDGTPVLDIKPYVSYSDSVADARCGFAPAAPDEKLEVRFSEQAQAELAGRNDDGSLQRLIRQVLALDPRPAYREDEPERVYGMRLEDVDLRWRVAEGVAEVLECAPFNDPGPSR